MHRTLILLAAFVIAGVALFGCGTNSGGDGDGDTDGDSDGDTDGDSDIDRANPCENREAICVSDADTCATQGGLHLTEGDSECIFDDGDGACCEPPTQQPSGDDCQSRGGLCAPIAGCGFVNGSFAPSSADCGPNPIMICCLPESICGEENVVCCGERTAYRPACDRGEFTCETFPDTELVLEDDCQIE